jgi:serine/threonine protein kinase
VRPDHKTVALSYFGSAKFMGKQFSNKDAIPYLAPKLYSSFGELEGAELQI